MSTSTSGTGVQSYGDAPEDRRRLSHVHPDDWRNPRPAAVYDLVVLGGGTAGLVCAMGAAGLGARVALAERHLLGGDCLNTGCVPSKALLAAARARNASRRGEAYGVASVEPPPLDFARVMARVRARRADIAAHDAAARLRDAGVDVFFGTARFTGRSTMAVDDATLRFSRAVIATGSRPAVPSIAGLDRTPFLTSDTLFDLDVLPAHLMVLGGGPIGCEMAQAFARLGSSVTVFESASRLLPRDDGDAAAIVADALRGDGVRVQCAVRVDAIDRDADGTTVRWSNDAGERGTVRGDALLVATGRQPTLEGLNLEAAGVELDARGVLVDDTLRSTNRRIFASGDVCGRYQFTHAADAMSRLVVQNALFFGRRRLSALIVPAVTYTDPEVAHVGVTQRQADTAGGRIETITVPLAEIDRAIVDEDTDGFLRAYHQRGRLLGCTIVAREAGDLIALAVDGVTRGASLASWSNAVLPYPTSSELYRKAGDAYRRQALTPRVRGWLERYFRWTRPRA